MKENNTKIDGYIRIKGSESNSYDINDIDYNKIKNSLTGITNFINKMMQTIKPLIDTMANYVQSYTPYFKGLAEAIEKAKQDPDSIINWYEYCEKLSEYFWTIPYGMKSSDLKNIIENVSSDIEFDKYMKTYFSKKLVGNLIKEIDENLPQKHKRLFNQIQKAYNEKSYALVNTGIMSIIDGLCTYLSTR
ncbi:MAG: hypothetical protein N2749_06600 [Clostridia bacterium]|nr:hypothetical protein [Clostridia bacterium]